MANPNAPVIAAGLRIESESDRSPMPLPKKSCGVTVSNDSAPTRLLPVPPTSHDTPAESSVSWAALFQKTYLSDTSMLSNPDCVVPLSGSPITRSPASENPRFGLRRLENSLLMSVCRYAGESPERPNCMNETVGSDRSSATNGSSMARVAGKEALPDEPVGPRRACHRPEDGGGAETDGIARRAHGDLPSSLRAPAAWAERAGDVGRRGGDELGDGASRRGPARAGPRRGRLA